eukprot:6202023-Pleurochrysis_carterae.AAC.4
MEHQLKLKRLSREGRDCSTQLTHFLHSGVTEMLTCRTTFSDITFADSATLAQIKSYHAPNCPGDAHQAPRSIPEL